ncbi:MAG: L-aspartate oxidase [Lachnospiraceae bacterium]|nr:L-aspartate oxidase [Lachnospiraceae bacterium]MBQ4068647.1 L-aspartate oxidase [Lachnospiraceae bacterium]
MKNSVYDVVIVGSGVAGCFTALHLPKEWKILMITKSSLEESDSFLAQGGICVLKDENDFESFYEDTMKAGHYENRPEAVREMIMSSRAVINELIEFGVDFHTENGKLCYTKEGAHSTNRILYYKDVTGKEIIRKLLARVKELENVTIKTNTEMIDILCKDNCCDGILLRNGEEELEVVFARHTMWACGGIGGIYENSTNYTHLTGDALALSIKHNIKIKNIDYVQIHPTTLYSNKKERRFLISESVRGEGAILLNKNGERFVDELQPRDVVSKAIFEQMEKDGTEHVWLSMMTIDDIDVTKRFPYICKRCMEEGIDVTKDLIPVVPAQHYFMGGVDVDLNSHTSMRHLYASGETCCNGVHGANRLASNSLLESLVFAKNAALHMNKVDKYTIAERYNITAETSREDRLNSMSKWSIDKIIEKYNIDLTEYEDYEGYTQRKKDAIWAEINKEKRKK